MVLRHRHTGLTEMADPDPGAHRDEIIVTTRREQHHGLAPRVKLDISVSIPEVALDIPLEEWYALRDRIQDVLLPVVAPYLDRVTVQGDSPEDADDGD